MDDDRGPDRRSSPDVLAATRKRKASRGLRVPNDPVPRASQPEVARVSIADDREIDEFGDRVTQVAPLSDDSDALVAQATIASSTETTDDGAREASPPPALVVPVDLAAARENEHAATAEDHTQHDPAPAPDAVGERRSLGPQRKPSSPRVIAVQDDAPAAVRQVRRRIRSIGTDEPHVSTVAAVPEAEAPDLSHSEEEFAATDAVGAVAAIIAGEDELVVERAAPAAVVESATSIETVSAAADEDEVQVDSSDVEDETPSVPAANASADAAAQPSLAARDAASDSEIETAADVEVEAEEESSVEVEDPTEEISIPDATDELHAKAATPPPRASMPDGSRPPPPPRATTGEATKPAERPTTVNADAKPRRRHWWEEIFNDDFLRTQRRYTPEQAKKEGDFIEASLGVEKGATVLDVGCGIGRQAVELASRGYEVLGMDLSLPMLSRASDTAQLRGVKLNFLQSDMLEMEFNELFDAAYCVGSTFGFFDDEKNADVIHRLHRALKPGGTLLLEVVNRDYAAPQHPAMTWYEADGCVCMEETQFNWFTSRLEGKRTLLLEDGRQREQKFSMRLYSLHELGKVLHGAGFRVIEVSGHQKTAGAFFGANSAMLIILAQKRADDD
ncbi:MAG: methyltransferase domain-containing protein [Myxococcales bacterium]|nr:methyltransferase domain-containing protein [Myxococcales bacterium]